MSDASLRTYVCMIDGMVYVISAYTHQDAVAQMRYYYPDMRGPIEVKNVSRARGVTELTLKGN